VGFTSGLLLLITPVFLAQVGIIYLDIPVAGLAAAGYYYYLRKDFGRYTFFATLMVLMKEVTVLIAGLFFILIVISELKSSKDFKHKIRAIVLVSIPMVALSLWFIYHKIYMGWVFINPDRVLHGLSPFQSWRFLYVIKMNFVDQWRFLILIFGLASLMYGWKNLRKNYKSIVNLKIKDLIPLLGIPVIMGLLFAVTEFLHRYTIVLLPFLYLGCISSIAYVLTAINGSKKFLTVSILSLVTVLMLILFYSEWDTHREINYFTYAPVEENLEYLNIINLSFQVSNYLEKNYPRAKIYGSFPFKFVLTQPYQHFVNTPLSFTECSHYKQGDVVDIIILHTISSGEIACYELAQKLNYNNLVYFRENGKYMALASR
jgi:hypothetical protein